MQRLALLTGVAILCLLLIGWIGSGYGTESSQAAMRAGRAAGPAVPLFAAAATADPRLPVSSPGATLSPSGPTPAAQKSTGPVTRTIVGPAPSPTAVKPTPANTLNGLPMDRIVSLPLAARQKIRQVYALGQGQGRNPRAFSKVGDSTMVWPPLLAVLDDPKSYKLGGYASLQPTIARFAGSFGRESIAAKNGMHTWSEFDPAWADPAVCKPEEGPLACEIRLNNPSVVIIRLGANDVSAPSRFNEQMRQIVEFCLARGIVPVLGTKPDRLEGADNTLNKLIYTIAAAYALPVWDYDLIAGTVPNKGLQADRVHYLGGGSRDYGNGAAFRSADSLEDLTALMMLDAVSREVGPPGAPRK